MKVKLFSGNKAQAAAAATLIAIVAASLIMFIILVSPDERELMLDGTSTGDDSSYETISEEILLSETPGRIDYLSQDEIEHSLASVRIYTKIDSVVLFEKNSLYAKNGIFSEEISESSFSITDIENTDSLALSFKVSDVSGNLIILLNGEELYNAEVNSGDTPVLTVSDYLLQSENSLVFKVSSPGLSFWKTNSVLIESLKVVGRHTDLDYQSASNTFLLSEVEYNNLEALELQFQPECNYDEVGRLTIVINDYNIYSGVPDCGLQMVPIEFSPDLVYEGENQIIFTTEYDEYQLYHMKIISDLKDVDYTTYYFSLSYEEQQAIENEDNSVKVNLEFTDDTSTKTGYVSVNGYKRHFDTKEISETLDVSELVVKGNNAIKIVPSKTIDLRELIVAL